MKNVFEKVENTVISLFRSFYIVSLYFRCDAEYNEPGPVRVSDCDSDSLRLRHTVTPVTRHETSLQAPGSKKAVCELQSP